MLKNAYLFAKIGADTAENEQFVLPRIAKKSGNYPTARRCGVRVSTQLHRDEPRPLEPLRGFAGPGSPKKKKEGAAEEEAPRERATFFFRRLFFLFWTTL